MLRDRSAGGRAASLRRAAGSGHGCSASSAPPCGAARGWGEMLSQESVTASCSSVIIKQLTSGKLVKCCLPPFFPSS